MVRSQIGLWETADNKKGVAGESLRILNPPQSKLSSKGLIISPAKEKLRKDWKSYLHLPFKALNSLCIFISPQIKNRAKVKPSDFMRADTQVTTHILPVRG